MRHHSLAHRPFSRRQALFLHDDAQALGPSCCDSTVENLGIVGTLSGQKWGEQLTCVLFGQQNIAQTVDDNA